jgi:FK506-binding protein 14
MIYAAALLALLASSAEAALTVTQTAGPTECEVKTAPGMHVSMHYTGSIDASSATGTAGKQFDSSIPRGKTFDFQLGAGKVIKGWEEGLVGLCRGAEATLVIPPEMGYGDRGAGNDIPGGATLHFDVQVVDFSSNAPPAPNLFKELDIAPQDGKLSEGELLTYFAKHGEGKIPDGLWENEDKNKDGFISWEEFGGPKGTKQEL